MMNDNAFTAYYVISNTKYSSENALTLVSCIEERRLHEQSRCRHNVTPCGIANKMNMKKS